MSTTDFIDLDTVAKRLNINVATLREAIDSGDLTAVKGVWRGYRTTEAWVDAWFSRKIVNPKAAGKAGGAA